MHINGRSRTGDASHSGGDSGDGKSPARPQRSSSRAKSRYANARSSTTSALPALVEADSAALPPCQEAASARDSVLCEATRGRRWHVVRPAVGRSGGQASFSGAAAGAAATATDLPPVLPADAEAVLLACEPDTVEPAAALAKSVRLQHGRDLQVIAVLAGGVDAFSVLTVQRALFANDIDDVILQMGSASELSLSIDMSIARLQHRDASRREFEQRVRVELEGQQPQQPQQQQQDGQRRRSTGAENELFWQVAHCIADGFPSLSTGIPKSVSPGAQVGPCQLRSVIGTGTFAEVYSAWNQEVRQVEAVKVISKSRIRRLEDFSGLLKEITTLEKLNHRNIVRLYGAMHGPGHLFVQMELVGRKSLFRVMKSAGGRLPLEVARDFHTQLSSALSHCHDRGVAHRDIKPENIGITDCGTQLKLLDFGCAWSTGKPCTDVMGTMPFIAPEAIAPSAEAPYAPAAGDVWAIGMVLLEMLCGIGTMNRMMGWSFAVEPSRKRAEEVFAFLSEQPVPWHEVLEEGFEEVPCALESLLAGMLAADPEARWTAAQVLGNDWLQSRCSYNGSNCSGSRTTGGSRSSSVQAASQPTAATPQPLQPLPPRTPRSKTQPLSKLRSRLFVDSPDAAIARPQQRGSQGATPQA